MTERTPPSPVYRPAETRTISSTTTSTIPPEALPPTALTTLETSLNSHQDRAFSFLTHIYHLPPTVATVFSTIYRTAFSSHTFLRTFAERNGYDTVWLWWATAIAAYVGLFGTDVVIGVLEKLLGLGKTLLLVPILGIPVCKAAGRRGLWEVLEFFFGREEEERRREEEERRMEREGREGERGGGESGT
ncbi:MAG: hypothetical protein Q9204_009491 [Flavoplaca sp. TL-2023a]